MRFWLCLLTVSLLAFSACGEDASDRKPVSQMSPGEKAFRLNCINCHSMTGTHRTSMEQLATRSSAFKDEETFMRFVRQPASIGQLEMQGFSEAEISDDGIRALYQWLQVSEPEPKAGE